MCTTHNPDSSSSCSVCLTARPPSAGEWGCGQCTAHNKAAAAKCSVCGSAKPVSAEEKARRALLRPCGICFEDVPIKDLAETFCEHTYCKVCASGYLGSKVMEGMVLNIACPTPKCKRMYTDEEAKALLDEGMFAKYARFKRNAELSRNPAVRWCQTPGCENAMFGSVAKPRLECETCKKAVCFTCNIPWHMGLTCGDIAREKKIRVDKETKAFKEFAQRSGFIQCIKCSVFIEKTQGCTKMHCRCGYKFCYRCGVKDATCSCAPGHGFYPIEQVLKNWEEA